VAVTSKRSATRCVEGSIPIVALAGGVGGAKLVQGLASVLPAQDLTVVVNTGDDEVFHGLYISPDLDTVMYSLAGLANRETGWGVAGDTFSALGMLKRYGAVGTWFNLGDKDLATHLERTRLLREGWTLSQATAHLCEKLGIQVSLVPMSDQPVRTVVETEEGVLPFQEYFVKHQCRPRVKRVRFEGAKTARISSSLEPAFRKAKALVMCPSNPIVSIGPILAVPNVRSRLDGFKGLRLAVSPIVAGQALRGPAAKMLQELGEEVSCVGVARRLREVCDIFVIDMLDSDRQQEIQALGLDMVVLDTVMNSDEDKARLARQILQVLRDRLA